MSSSATQDDGIDTQNHTSLQQQLRALTHSTNTQIQLPISSLQFHFWTSSNINIKSSLIQSQLSFLDVFAGHKGELNHLEQEVSQRCQGWDASYKWQ